MDVWQQATPMLFLVGWFILQAWVLPRFGVAT
jgi:hypothetical protein